MPTEKTHLSVGKKVSASGSDKVFRVRVKLRNFNPPIWRRIEVPYNFTLHELHLVIQAAMGWENYHLYTFRVGRTSYSIPNDEWPNEDIDSRKTKIKNLIFIGPKSKMIYEYDFGDSWEHDVTIEKIIPAEIGVNYPRCVSGKLACPPEDSGGTYGYARKLGIIENPKDEEYEETVECLGEDFDAEHFDL